MSPLKDNYSLLRKTFSLSKDRISKFVKQITLDFLFNYFRPELIRNTASVTVMRWFILAMENIGISVKYTFL